jgi:putative ABC transport system permease protein
MKRFPGFKRLMRIERPGIAVDRAVDDELRFHFEMTMKELVSAGMTPEEARREAERRFGDVAKTRDRLATIDHARLGSARRAAWWSAFSQELYYAVRGLKLKPGFAAGVVITLGLGVGANAAMFGIVDRLLFRPPAYMIAPERAHRIYFGRTARDGKEFVGRGTSYQSFMDLSRSARSMEVLVPYSDRRFAVGTGEAARELHIGAATADLWKLFSARPAIGRFFTSDDDAPSANPVVVLGYRYWQSEYGGSRDVIGKSVTIGPSTFTIIGVAPRGFAAADIAEASAFIPINEAAVVSFSASGWEKYRTAYNVFWLEIIGRRRADVSADAATADLSRAFVESYRLQMAGNPKTPPLSVARPRAIAAPINLDRGPQASADSKVATWLLGVATIVLLIACANVSNLLLSRAFSRRREIAVRMALGVSRARLAAQLFIESMLLALLGAVAGLAVAQWGGQALRAALLRDVELPSTIADPRVLAFAATCAMGAGLLAGFAPIVQAGRTDVATALKAGSREGHGRRSAVRTTLLVVQAALSVVLLVGAGLFVRSVRNADSQRLGFEPEPLVWIEPHLRGTKLDSAQQVHLIRALLDGARNNPSVENASLLVTVPRGRTFGDEVFAGADSLREIKDGLLQVASPEYFATMRTRILRGRRFTASDDAGAPRVAIVSEELARQAWPNLDPLGRCIRVSADTMPCRTVVGVAENIKLGDLAAPPDPIFYLPPAQSDEGDANLIVRVRGSAALQIDALRRDLQRLMPGAAYVSATPLTQVLEPVTRSWRLGATMFVAFGALALTLAAIGLYSVVSYVVKQRTHEMGVRIALGAQVADVVRLIVADGVRVIIAGVAIGALASLVAGRWIAPLLFNVSPKDPVVFSAVAVVLIAVAVSASWIPALRASRVDPSSAMRSD